MAALVLTESDVLPNADTANITRTVLAGATITAGQPVYKDSALKYHPARSGTAEASSVEGISLNGAALNQPFEIIVGGVIDFNAVVSVGEPYYSGTGAGSIVPDADLGTGDYVTFLGIGKTTTQLLLHIRPTGISHA